MSPFQFDSDMSDASTTPVVRIPADLSNLGDLAPPQLVRQTAEHRDLSHLGDLTPIQLVRQPAEHRDPWEIAIEVDYIPFTAAPLTIALSSDLIDVDLQYVPNRRGRRINRSFSRSPAPDRSFPEGHVLPLFRSRSYSR